MGKIAIHDGKGKASEEKITEEKKELRGRQEEQAAVKEAPSESPQPKAVPPVSPEPMDDEDVLAKTNSLWKYHEIPSEEKEPDRYPEYLVGADPQKAGWHPSSVPTVAARVRGKKHKNDGTNCDDWYKVAEWEDIALFAVSDGAGSKRFSRVGAKAACEAALAYLQEELPHFFRQNPEIRANLDLDPKGKGYATYVKMAMLADCAVAKGYDGIVAAFDERKEAPQYREVLGRELMLSDFSCTFLLAMVVPLKSGNAVFTCQVGDGMIALIRSNQEVSSMLKLMADADSGDFSGETDFLTSPKIMQRAEDGSWPELQRRTKMSKTKANVLLLMTDGVADDYYPNDPEIIRLYFDLIVNDIWMYDDAEIIQIPGGAEGASLERAMEFGVKPRSYSWINDPAKKVPLVYAEDVQEKTGASLQQLWENKEDLRNAFRLMRGKWETQNRDERLKIWLDNYTERGSFDDRTLVVARLKR